MAVQGTVVVMGILIPLHTLPRFVHHHTAGTLVIIKQVHGCVCHLVNVKVPLALLLHAYLT